MTPSYSVLEMVTRDPSYLERSDTLDEFYTAVRDSL